MCFNALELYGAAKEGSRILITDDDCMGVCVCVLADGMLLLPQRDYPVILISLEKSCL